MALHSKDNIHQLNILANNSAPQGQYPQGQHREQGQYGTLPGQFGGAPPEQFSGAGPYSTPSQFGGAAL